MPDRNTPSVLAVIPAKASSSRVPPSKNLRWLGGLPLFLWTVRSAVAVESPKLTVVVSTDEGKAGDEIARIAMANGADVVRRPPELCRDPAEAPDVAIHALEAYRSGMGSYPDAVCMLLPTSPFRMAAHIEAAIALHFDSEDAFTGKRPNIVSVQDASDHLRHKLLFGQLPSPRERGVIVTGPPLRDIDTLFEWSSQTAMLLNGALWITSPERLLRARHISAIGATPYVMDSISGLDIDTPFDFAIAEAALASGLVTIP